MDPYNLGIIITTLLFSAFFSGTEIAFISANKLQVELESQQGKLGGRIMSFFTQKPSRLINTALVGNTIALVIYGIYMALLLEPWIASKLPESINNSSTVVLIQTVISTIIVLITAEFTPKSIFLINPNNLLNIFSLPLLVVFTIMFPLVWLIEQMSRFIIIYVLRQPFSEDKQIFGLTDLGNYVNSNDERDTKEAKVELDTKIFNNALEFKTIKVRECMIPRTEISAVDIEESIEELKQEFIDSGHSKVLVYKGSIDDVIGFCHVQDLFKKPKEIGDLLKPIIIVPETVLANELLIQFIQEGKSLALVVDEFGGTSGIVSMEDVIEEIFGEIQDEHDDDEDWVEQKVDDYNYILSARHEVDYLNDTYGWQIPEGEYDTLGGFVLSITEDIPEVHQVVDADNYSIKILTMEDTRIDNVMFTIKVGQQD